jgi:hypothetical protein
VGGEFEPRWYWAAPLESERRPSMIGRRRAPRCGERARRLKQLQPRPRSLSPPSPASSRVPPAGARDAVAPRRGRGSPARLQRNRPGKSLHRPAGDEEKHHPSLLFLDKKKHHPSRLRPRRAAALMGKGKGKESRVKKKP